MLLKVKLNKYIFDKITNYYTDLYYERLKNYPNDRSYSKKQLLCNIKTAKSIHNATITDNNITQPIYTPWIDNGWKEIKANNWHYAVVLMKNTNGTIVAIGQDAHHKNDNHNDTMQTKPYNESWNVSKTRLVKLISEAIMKHLYCK
ncbi:MAG: hypothetical protein ACI311_06735 [Bacilli bacterium]